MLGDEQPLQVEGDRHSGFFRTADAGGRHVEAYTWGGLTSGSPSRAVWLLLLPFSVVNVAGWATAGGVSTSRLLRAILRLVAVGMTAAYVLWVITLAMDVVAYQYCRNSPCGSQSPWWQWPLANPTVASRVTRRLAVAALAPLGTVVALWVAAFVSWKRYDLTTAASTGTTRDPGQTQEHELSDPRFWYSPWQRRRLRAAHVTVGLATIALVLGWATRELTAGAAADGGWLLTAGLVTAAVAATGGLVAAAVPGRRLGRPIGALPVVAI
ncbi:MAG: hypothetical protein ACRDYV_21745, partial [Acidimicrobiia bacterium]